MSCGKCGREVKNYGVFLGGIRCANWCDKMHKIELHPAFVWDCDNCDAWMPASELPDFSPVPDPPEGWRFTEQNEAVDERALFWSITNKNWTVRGAPSRSYDEDLAYIVPIDKPKLKHRQFANAAEFEPYRERWVLEESRIYRVTSYCDVFVEVNTMTYEWDEALRILKFDDGSPFDVEIAE